MITTDNLLAMPFIAVVGLLWQMVNIVLWLNLATKTIEKRAYYKGMEWYLYLIILTFLMLSGTLLYEMVAMKGNVTYKPFIWQSIDTFLIIIFYKKLKLKEKYLDEIKYLKEKLHTYETISNS